MSGLSLLLIVLRKELADALRDRRTLIVVLISSVLLGPLVLVALSGLIATLEAQAEKREVVVSGIEHAPALRNFIERQSYVVTPAPADYEAKLRAQKLGDPVLVVPPGFEAALLRGEQPTLAIVSDTGNKAAEAGAGRVQRLLAAWRCAASRRSCWNRCRSRSATWPAPRGGPRSSPACCRSS
jgi:sodium transport system permease protein